MPAPLVLDPFFDSAGGGGAGTAAIAHTPDPARYHDASAVQLGNGKTIGDYVEGATIIPRSTEGGVPRGFNPHDVQNMQIVIDPFIPSEDGGKFTLNLHDLTKENVAAASRESGADARVSDFPTLRAMSSHTLRGLQNGTPHVQQPQQPLYVPGPPQQQAAPQILRLQPVGSEQFVKTGASPILQVAPSAAFTQRPSTAFAPQPQTLPQQPPPVPPASHYMAAGFPPKVKVTFELPGFGVHASKYHEVIRNGLFVVLIWRHDYEQSEPFWPTGGENAPPLYVQVEGDAEVYLAHVSGVQYIYDKVEHCVLLVEDVRTVKEG